MRAAFEEAAPYTVGFEDEVMLLDPETLHLVPRAKETLAHVGEDPRFKLEFPASQLEILTSPVADVPAAAAALLEARRDLQRAVDGRVRLGAAGFHPFSPALGELNDAPRYAHTRREYGAIAARQLVCALQVHVSVGNADRALAVYNGLRGHLPALAARAANAPFYEGRDAGLASVRPKIGELLPRQGVPPAIESWEGYADALRWGVAAGALPDQSSWWWELRPHPAFGTLELRVPDAQTTVADAAAVGAVAQSLVVWLGGRHDAGEDLAPAPTWRIEENRWSACRHGVEGAMADLRTGARRPTREVLHALLDTLAPIASEVGGAAPLDHARELVEVNGAMTQRRIAASSGMPGLGEWLAERFVHEPAA
ncbi:MAG: glutamate---cysteine ligase / carboxylate-amine ligase [Solirubrobacteraceae bacterium]|nr:glutamate---cysteine ligase / carboxylate-amine ligase [Solirubrobacteraceae bacterium]